MTDLDFMRHAFKGNESAVGFILIVRKIVDVWDNLIDKDVPVSDAEIHDAFWQAMVELPSNDFFRVNQLSLMPLIVNGILNWKTANRMERDPETTRAGLEIAHVIRYSIADVALMSATLIGGIQWAEEVGPEMRMRSQRSDFAEYMTSLNRAGEAQ